MPSIFGQSNQSDLFAKFEMIRKTRGCTSSCSAERKCATRMG